MYGSTDLVAFRDLGQKLARSRKMGFFLKGIIVIEIEGIVIIILFSF